MKPGLYIVATPIGNLNDITLRALDVLKKSDMILCENTKHSLKLLKFFNINGIKLDKYTDHDFVRKHKLIENDIKLGKKISLISDAGSPLISDPGSNLIKHLFDNNCHVETIPGPSSTIAAVQLSGFFNAYPIVFLGFLPKKNTQKIKIIESFIKSNLVIFSTSHQLNSDIETIFLSDPGSKVVILSEITKKYEKRIVLTAQDYEARRPISLKGEFVLCVEFNGKLISLKINDTQIKKDIKKFGSKEIYDIYKTRYNLSRNDLYKKILKLKSN